MGSTFRQGIEKEVGMLLLEEQKKHEVKEPPKKKRRVALTSVRDLGS